MIDKVRLIPEIDFVLLCACTAPDSQRCSRIREIADSSPDWELIYNISIEQRVFPLIYKNIRELLPDRVPAVIVRKFRHSCFDTAKRSLHFSSYLFTILDLFKENGILALPFKGPVLAQDVYGDPGLRSFGDLDILVSKKDALKAWQILLDSGFNTQLELYSTTNQKYIRSTVSSEREKYIRSTKHIVFSKEQIAVELHWQMSNSISNPITIESVTTKSNKLLMHNREVLNLQPEPLLVYLCIHGADHAWAYLEQVCSVAEILKKNKSLDWDIVIDLGIQWCSRKKLYLGLYLAFKLLDAPLPEVIMDQIKKYRLIQGLAIDVFVCMFRHELKLETRRLSNSFSLFRIQTMDSLTEKLRWIISVLFRPSKNDPPLPEALFFLYFFLRPLRLIKESIKEKKAEWAGLISVSEKKSPF